MKYIINSNNKLYLPSVQRWVLDDLHLNVLEGMLYSMCLQKGFIVWSADYIGYILKCSKSTILRTVDKLVAADVLHKTLVRISGKSRFILIALYTDKGLRSDSEIHELIEQGKKKLKLLYSSEI